MLTKIVDIILTVIMVVSGTLSGYTVKKTEWKTNYTCVFVHGLCGWGSYDTADKMVNYWGMFSGDFLGKLKNSGFDCVAASVAPMGSAWDRACELYAQLTGSRVDYGKEHSERMGHARYGTDYRGRALLDKWDGTDKINLIGHSFGGNTIRLFSELLKNGSEAERAVTPESELSGLFTGGKESYIYSMTCLSSPLNGTSAYTVADEGEIVQRTNDGLTGGIRSVFASVISIGTQPIKDGRDERDYASKDMYIDNALAINDTIGTLDSVYYFSAPTSCTFINEEGVYEPDVANTEELFVGCAELIGKFVGYTDGGYYLDESWRDNDGLVNVKSAQAPFNAESRELDENDIKPGVWNVYPTMRGDHMTFMGGLSKRHTEVKKFLLKHLDMINRL